MARKAINFKMDEEEIAEMKKAAEVYGMTLTELLKNAVREYLNVLERGPCYRLTMNVEDASEEESVEILSRLENMDADDLKIVSKKRFSV